MVSNTVLGEMSDKKIIDSLLKGVFKDLPQRPRWVDGSGLSRYNLFTPEDMVSILQKMAKEFGMTRIKQVFPGANQGTLKGYYTSAQGKIFAKTGTLSDVVALSGYLTTSKGNEVIFSVIVNAHQSPSAAVRRAIEKFLLNYLNSH